MAATIRDIRKMTGLSLATVSKYLNGGNVLPENRAAIENAIEVLHYEVNEVARGLATNRTKTIGVLIQRLDHIFSSTIIAEMEGILRAHDYGTIVCDCQGDEKLEEESIRFLLGKRVDGIITIPTSATSTYLNSALAREIPVVLIDRSFQDREWDSVLVDNVEASREAIKLLAEKGHQKIAIVCGEERYYTAKLRLQGYMEACREAGISVNDRYVKMGTLDIQHGYDGIMELVSMDDPPTAVFLSNYEITLGAVMALNENGIRVPEQISVVGFDNLMLAKVVRPKLWMVVQPMEEIARNAAELMLRRLEGEKTDEVEKIVLSTNLLPGESIRKCE